MNYEFLFWKKKNCGNCKKKKKKKKEKKKKENQWVIEIQDERKKGKSVEHRAFFRKGNCFGRWWICDIMHRSKSTKPNHTKSKS